MISVVFPLYRGFRQGEPSISRTNSPSPQSLLDTGLTITPYYLLLYCHMRTASVSGSGLREMFILGFDSLLERILAEIYLGLFSVFFTFNIPVALLVLHTSH